jgi:DNA polymerase I-like protein with 3'-5' exonuclease and polymerase domains
MKRESDVWCAIDFETTSINKYSCEIVGLGICKFDIETGKIKEKEYLTVINAFTLLYPNSFVMHNASFDLHLLRRKDPCPSRPIHDTYLMAKHVNNLLPAFNLKSLAWFYFGETYLELAALKQWFREQNLSDDERYMNMSLPPKKLVEAYCLKDVEMTARLAHVFWKELKGNYAYELDRRTILHTCETEERGIAADLRFYQEYKRKGLRRITYNRRKGAAHMGTRANPMGHALRDHLKSLGESRTTTSGLTKADKTVLRDWRKRDKTIGSVERVRRDRHNISHFAEHVLAASVPLSNGIGIFHPNFIQSGAVTRRYRCAGFHGSQGVTVKGNTQNFPPVMREGIIARPGYEFWKLDLASIEARMFSAFMEILMGESVFAEMYRKDKNFNPYLWVIERCTRHGKVTKKHELYIPYKHGVLGRLYCSGAQRFATQLRDKFELDYTEGDCRDIYDSIDRNCPFIKRFQRFLLNLAESQGYLLDPFGACYFQPNHKPYEIVAHIHQGAAGNVLKWWMCEISEAMKETDDHIVNAVHDEFDCEIRKGNRPATRVKGYCEALQKLDLFGLPIMAEATRGKNWKECG